MSTEVNIIDKLEAQILIEKCLKCTHTLAFNVLPTLKISWICEAK